MDSKGNIHSSTTCSYTQSAGMENSFIVKKERKGSQLVRTVSVLSKAHILLQKGSKPPSCGTLSKTFYTPSILVESVNTLHLPIHHHTCWFGLIYTGTKCLYTEAMQQLRNILHETEKNFGHCFQPSVRALIATSWCALHWHWFPLLCTPQHSPFF